MNRLYSSLLAATALTFTAAAQQLPNNDFEGSWNTCTPWTDGKGNITIGENPQDWCISHVMGVTTGTFKGQGKQALGEKIEGNGSLSAVKIYNQETGVKLLNLTREVPGYLTTGTTWSTAQGTNESTHDGGTWGGTAFTYRPDAISFYYKRQYKSNDATTEPCSFILYLWKGSTTQIDVPVTITSGTAATKTTMTNRDRNVLEYETTSTGGKVTKSEDFELIGKVIKTQAGAVEEWTEMTLPIDYITASTPGMINVIFAANDYFNTSATPVIDNSLSIDDVKLVYYSRLKSLSINGTAVADFDPNTYEYNVDAEMPADVSAIVAECLGNSGSGKAVVALDAANNKATITVTNSNSDMVGRASTEGVADVDGAATHTYVLQFKKAENPSDDNSISFPGKLLITMGESHMNSDATVVITPEADNKCKVVLPDFSLDINEDGNPVNLGDIVVENATRTENADRSYSYAGTVHHMSLAGGEIIANVTMTGTEQPDGNLTLNISVVWLLNPDNDPEGTESSMPIEVVFNGSKKTSAIGGIESDVIDENAPVEYYNIQGMKVNADNLTPGFYIVRQGKKVSKIFVK